MSVTLDIKDGTAARYTAERGWEFERIAIAYNVPGTGQEKFKNAKDASGMPLLYDEHPAVPAATLKGMEFSQIDTDTVRVALTYRQNLAGDYTSNDPTIQIGSSVQQVESHLDKTGATIELEYAFPSDYDARTDWRGTTQPQGGFFSKFTPQRTYTVTKEESSSIDAVDIEGWNNTYVGKINSGSWRNYPARTWLCTGISGSSTNGGDTYIVTYSFQFNAKTWAAHVIYVDPNTGKPPTDLVFGTGYKIVEVYDEVSFSNIGTL